MLVRVERRYLDHGRPVMEEVQWVQAPSRRARIFRGRDPEAIDVRKARPLPRWCDPGLSPNLWVWTVGLRLAADLSTVIPDIVSASWVSDGKGGLREEAETAYGPGSRYWSLYDLPLRAGCQLVHRSVWDRIIEAQQREGVG